MDADFQARTIRFESRPSRDVLAALKHHGARWQPYSKVWLVKRGDDMLGLVEWIRSQERRQAGLPAHPSACLHCGAPGELRRFGPFVEGYCDACYTKAREAHREELPDPGELAVDRWAETQTGL